MNSFDIYKIVHTDQSTSQAVVNVLRQNNSSLHKPKVTLWEIQYLMSIMSENMENNLDTL